MLVTTAAVLGLLVAALTAVALIGQGLRLLWRTATAILRIADALPTLLKVAEQFRPNGGSSLHDTVTRSARAIERLDVGMRALLMDLGYSSVDDYVAAKTQQIERREGGK